jgi:putative aminopeptidase FrvX
VEAVGPDVAVILESDIAGDVPGIKPEVSSVKLGKGPSLLIYDARMIPNLKLRDLALDTARSTGVGLQLSAIEAGATDGGAIHLHKTGVPTSCWASLPDTSIRIAPSSIAAITTGGACCRRWSTGSTRPRSPR